MEILYWYLLFAATTGFAGLYELYNPVLNRIKQFHPESTLVKNKSIGYLTAFTSFVMLAPVIFVICIVPELGESFRDSMYRGSVSQD